MSDILSRFDSIIQKRNELLAREERVKGRRDEICSGLKKQGIDVKSIGAEREKREERKVKLMARLEVELTKIEKALSKAEMDMDKT